MSKQGMVVKGMMDYDSVVNFFEDFIKSFKEKTICVQRGEDFITLKPSDSMEVEIEASVKKGKQKISIELEWREEVPVENDVAFKVSAVEPEPAPEPEPEATAEEAPAASEKKEECDKADSKKAETPCPVTPPKSIEVVSSPSILAPTPTSKPVVEAKADSKSDDAAAPKGGSKSAAKAKSEGAKKSSTTK